MNRQQVTQLLCAARDKVPAIIEQAYMDYASGSVVNPHSLFLRPAGRPSDRVIALPAGVFSAKSAMGIKWISSFPGNSSRGLERASAAIILNDVETGFPTAIVEGAVVSAWRTAASASVACRRLDKGFKRTRIALVGCGIIGNRTVEALLEAGWSLSELALFDLARERAVACSQRWAERGFAVRVCETAADAVALGEIVVFATTATEPWFKERAALAGNPIVLHLSLRDLDPDLVGQARNIVDDADHALRAGTTLELAAVKFGDRSFVDADMGELLSGRFEWRQDTPVFFSPFGLGVLDISLASYVVERAEEAEVGVVMADFFGPLEASS